MFLVVFIDLCVNLSNMCKIEKVTDFLPALTTNLKVGKNKSDLVKNVRPGLLFRMVLMINLI